MNAEDRAEIVVEVDADLAEVVPGYLENRRRELDLLAAALAGADWETLRRLAHDLKGTGGGYGFAAISELGLRLERAAQAGDAGAAADALEAMRAFLQKVRVVFVSVG